MSSSSAAVSAERSMSMSSALVAAARLSDTCQLLFVVRDPFYLWSVAAVQNKDMKYSFLRPGWGASRERIKRSKQLLGSSFPAIQSPERIAVRQGAAQRQRGQGQMGAGHWAGI